MSKTITAIIRGFKAGRQAMGTHQSGIPNYEQMKYTLWCIVLGLMWLYGHPDPDSIRKLIILALVALLSVYIADIVAEWREWKVRHKTSSKND